MTAQDNLSGTSHPYHFLLGKEIPSPTPNSPTHIEIPESCLPLRKRVRFASPLVVEVGGDVQQPVPARQFDVPPRCSTSRELDYGITDTWDDLVGAIDEIAPTTPEGVHQRVTDLATIVEEETTFMYGIMEDAQDDRSQLRVRVNLLYRDRPVHRRLAIVYVIYVLRVVEQRALNRSYSSTVGRRFRDSMDPLKVRHSLMHQERLVAVPRVGYVLAMYAAVKVLLGLSQLADCIDLLFVELPV
ncbi:hypothetical protein Tco_0413274 [Tanacetum coccineum]